MSRLGHRAIYGIHAVEEVLRRRPASITALLVQKDAQDMASSALKPLLQKAQASGVSVLFRPKPELDRITDLGVHQGIVALDEEFQYAPLNTLLSNIQSQRTNPLLLLLDGVTDPHNLGSLIRSAHVLGVQGLILPQDRSASVTPVVVKTSSGATEWLPIVKVPNLVRAMEHLKEIGIWLFGTTLQGEHTKPPWELDFRIPSGIVLGSEGVGLRPLVQKTCDFRVHIPMQGALQGGSLNVGVCGGVLMYEILKQRLT